MMGSVITLQSSSRINTPILCTFLFLYVAFSQALDPEPYIFKENDENVLVEMTIPPGDQVIRVSSGADFDKTALFVSGSRVIIPESYRKIISARMDNTRKKINIEFIAMKLDYANSYKCYQSSSSNVFDNCGFKIIVLAKPSQPTIKVSEDSSLLVDGTASLHCDFISNTKPSDHGLKPFVVWKDGDGNILPPVSERISFSDNGSLMLPDISRSDRGKTLRCQVADDPGDRNDKIFSDDSPIFEIIPEYPPSDTDFTIRPDFRNNSIIKIGENKELKYTCSVDCQPACRVEWKRKSYGKDKYTPMPVSADPTVLYFDSVSRTDQGSYICEGENEHGRNNKGFILEVLYILTPEVVVSNTRAWRKSVIEGDKEEVHLTCFIDANPEPSVVWKNPDNWLINQSTFTGPEIKKGNNSVDLKRYSSQIVLKDLKCEDGGSYKCEAKNILEFPVTGQIQIEVKCQPAALVKNQPPFLEDSLLLQDEYVWDLGGSLTGQFVIRAWPSPKVKRIVSSLNGISREESTTKSMTISTQHPFKNRSYLTLFSFRSLQKLTLADRGRVYTFVMENADFESKFRFTIQPRGPPLPVSVLNATEISHNAITLSWVPEFDGGDTQSFSIYLRPEPSSSSSFSSLPSSDWDLVMSGVEEGDNDDDGSNKVSVRVKSLSASTSYEIVVMSVNRRGNATTSIVFKTKASPASSANTGAIVGSVLAVLIVLIIVGLVLFYFLVYKKRWGKDSDGESSIPMIGRMSKIFRGRKGDPNGNAVGSDSQKSKFRPIFLGKSKTPKPKDKDYSNVPTESVDPTEYTNADSIAQQLSVKPPVRSSSIQEPFDDDGKVDERVVTDDGLTYVKIDFQSTPPPKPRRLDNQDPPAAGAGNASGDGCPYSSIDFEKTKAKEEEMRRLKEEEEEAKKREEEERRRREEEEEEEESVDAPYENFSSLGTTV